MSKVEVSVGAIRRIAGWSFLCIGALLFVGCTTPMTLSDWKPRLPALPTSNPFSNVRVEAPKLLSKLKPTRLIPAMPTSFPAMPTKFPVLQTKFRSDRVRVSDNSLGESSGTRFTSWLPEFLKNKKYDRDEIREEFQIAKLHLQDGDYKVAEKAFKQVAGRNRPRLSNRRLTTRDNVATFTDSKKTAIKRKKWHGSNPYREDALFFVAECQFLQEKYPAAITSYERLMQEYESTKHMNSATKRMFTVAKKWLHVTDHTSSTDIQQVALDDTDEELAKQPKKISFFSPFDRTRPFFDTQGKALSALKSIWLNDPSGPLADDALVLSATHFLRKGDYQESDRFFKILREQYPKSPHLQSAFVLGSHVKLMSYQGPDYDSSQLEDAAKLKKSTLRMFPNIPERKRIEADLANIQENNAGRDWFRVQYYITKDNPKAVVVYCKEILRKHPESSFASKARATLARYQAIIDNPDLADAEETTYRISVPGLPWTKNAEDTAADEEQEEKLEEPARIRLSN